MVVAGCVVRQSVHRSIGWALDRCGVPFREKAYLPRLGEPLMRLRCGRWSGRITVPILLAEGQALGDSYDIARWAAE